jgi:HSP20 family protein
MSPYASEPESGYGSGPFSLMRRISDEMDRFFENFGMGRGFFPSQERETWSEGQYGGQNVPSMWSPHIEVCERNGKLLIQADLPGMQRDDINVRIEQDAVVIQGERNQQQTSNQSGYYRSERSYGSFYRTIPLPEGTNTESATASFRDGVLEIELDAPREQQRGRTLEIREGGSASGSYGGSGSMQGGHAGTGSGSTYGSGTSGSMQGSTSGGSGSGSSGTMHASGASSGSQQSGSSGGQHSASGTTGSQQASGTGTMYSGSGNPSTGAAGMGSSSDGDRANDKSRGSGES